MSCPCNPRTGPDFDPDREGVSEADMERFGCDDDSYFYEDELDPYAETKSSKPWVPVAAGAVLVGFVLLFVF